jgi:hypothetical protein
MLNALMEDTKQFLLCALCAFVVDVSRLTNTRPKPTLLSHHKGTKFTKYSQRTTAFIKFEKVSVLISGGRRRRKPQRPLDFGNLSSYYYLGPGHRASSCAGVGVPYQDERPQSALVHGCLRNVLGCYLPPLPSSFIIPIARNLK